MSWDAAPRRRLRLDCEGYRELRMKILERDGWRCQQCGRRSQLEVHHTYRRSRGGSDSQDNLITLCRTCHGDIHGSCQK